MDVMELDAEIQRVQRELNRTIRQRRDDVRCDGEGRARLQAGVLQILHATGAERNDA